MKLLNILNELSINNPTIIKIGDKLIDEDGIEHMYIDQNLVLKYLLPKFPNKKQAIKDMVEEWNDFGSDNEEDMFTSLPELIETFENYLEDYIP